jgi:4-aminobutyrate aminotransferase
MKKHEFKPGPKSKAVMLRDRKVIAQCLTREYPFVYERAKGVHVWDADGAEYLDFMAGVAVQSVGHDNPEVVAAIDAQLHRGLHCGFSDVYAEVPVAFSETLVSMLPRGLDSVFLSNSGTEAVEAAYKLARYYKNRKWTIAFKNAFHGRTMGALSMTNSKPVQRERYAPFLPVKHVPYPAWYHMRMEPRECSDHCLGEMEDAMRGVKDDLASVFIEPVQGEGGYIVPPREFIPGVRRLCDEYGALLCDDEVQAGCFRTGKFLAIENFNVKPDVVAMSKAIGGGIPLGATIASRRLTKVWKHGSHANTFGGNLLACAGGIASLRYMRKAGLAENALRVGKLMMMRLMEMELQYEMVGDVRGLGLMIGVEIVKSKNSRTPDPKRCDAIIHNGLKRGLLLLPAGESVVRICPPLTLTEEQAEKGMDILEESIKASSR